MRSKVLWVAVALFGGIGLYALTSPTTFAPPEHFPQPDAAESVVGEPTVATFGSGCFWCTEAVFQQLKGVRSVTSGYSGGSADDAKYPLVCSGTTGHAEVVQVEFDPAVVSYPELLEVFWRSHDPTTPNRQGNDSGPQYRSVIFTHSERQRELAERYKTRIDEAGVYASPIVTEIKAFEAFYPAEAGHQDYFAANRRAPYCRAVIAPKMDKLRKVFGDRLVSDE